MTWDSQTYLKTTQYRDRSNLDARAQLHKKYGRADWYPWLVSQANIAPCARCLDAGCGTGAFWHDMASALPENLALDLVDLSDAMVEAASAQLREPLVLAEGTYATVDAQVADVQNLPFADAVFDWGLASHMLQHVPDVEQGVRELKRVLKPAGQLIVVQNDKEHMRQLVELTARVFGAMSQDRSMQMRGTAETLGVLRNHFTAVEVVPFPDDLVCTDPNDVIAYVLSVHHIKDDAEKMKALRAAVDAAFTAGAGVFRIRKDVKVMRCTL
jgi:ubiquinone/menaquinone biosynthesis C-methylase UbiE